MPEIRERNGHGEPPVDRCATEGCDKPRRPAYTGQRKRHPYCRDCHAERQRGYRFEQPDGYGARRAFEYLQRLAQRQLRAAVLRGELTPQPCATCGSPRSTEAHHPDYHQPLLVVWYCKRHHEAVHHQAPPWVDPVQEEEIVHA